MLFSSSLAFAQDPGITRMAKVRHAEPLYMDLVRDLGARKGEQEWNIGAQLSSNKSYTMHSAFVEYEFAPFNRLGFEIELPFSFYTPHAALQPPAEVQHNRMEGIKLAAQYTFLVSREYRLSMAAVYSHEIMFHSFHTMSRKQVLLKAYSYYPAIAVAKRWGENVHSLLYAGPEWIYSKTERSTQGEFQLNASLHYTFPQTRNFVGMELNQVYEPGQVGTVLRPQVKLALGNTSAIGIVTGIPLDQDDEGLSFMLRFVYEPKNR